MDKKFANTITILFPYRSSMLLIFRKEIRYSTYRKMADAPIIMLSIPISLISSISRRIVKKEHQDRKDQGYPASCDTGI